MNIPRLATFFAGVLIVALLFAGTAVPQASASQSPNLQLGVFMPDVNELGNFESSIGRQTDIFLWYQAIGEHLDTYSLGPVAAAGKTIQMAWEPRDPSNPDGVNQPAYRLDNITRGDFDNDIRRWAQDLKNFGYPVILRPMCEMNGDWTSWSGTANGNQPEDYIPAWRHIHDIFVQEGATNVQWVWSPNQDNTLAEAQNTFDTYYPGDAYVDYVGINGYNWGTMYSTPNWSSSWKSFTETFQFNYDVAVSRTSKPVMISETASTAVGENAQNGGKALWITDAFAQLPVRFPRIVSLTWFNINKETDWRVESSAESMQAFRAAVQGPDAVAPAVAITSPAQGSNISGDQTVNVSASDDSGVSRVELYAGDTLIETRTAAPYSFTFGSRTVGDGSYTLTARAYDAAGNTSDASVVVSVNNSNDRNYYFGWYDSGSPGAMAWVIIGNSEAVAQHADVYIGGRLMGSYDVGPKQMVTPMYTGVINGPVKVVSTTGGKLLVSERVLWNGYFSELAAATEDDLSTDQNMGWYDEKSPGMRDWVIIGNQGNLTAEVDVFIAGELRGHYSIPAGGRVTPDYPGVMNGPVRVISTNDQPLNVSQRVLYGSAFNEVGAVPGNRLSSEYYFTWYDQKSPGMLNWIIIGNQGNNVSEVAVYVGGQHMGTYSVPVGGRVTPSYPGTMNGPVRVVSTNGQPMIVSQRTLFKGSFEEVSGMPPSELGSEAWFPWYDNSSPGMMTWILVGNQSQETAEVDINIGGSKVGHYSIPAGSRVTPVFPGKMNGPVQVVSTQGQPQLVVSQRVIYNNSFDEVPGMLFNQT